MEEVLEALALCNTVRRISLQIKKAIASVIVFEQVELLARGH